MMNLQKDKWSNATLQDLTYRVTKGTTPTSLGKSFTANGINFIKAESITDDGIFIKEKFAYIDDETNALLKRSILEEEDLLFSIAGVIGRVAVVHSDILPANTNQALAVISPKKEFITPYYLKYYFSSTRFKAFIKSKTVQTAQANVSLSILSATPVDFPSLSEQQRIVGLFQSVEQSIVQAEKQEDNLLVLKSQLLRELISERKKFGNFLTAKDFEKVRFEKVALNISERIEPKQTDLEIYVGLEHLDSDDLVIRRKGKPEDVIGTKLKIFKGDIIFGKRRAYLRKVAVADFDGIVSAHSMVLRANEENIEKDFLPYFMQSDEFMNRAVQISEGSLSPTIKWKTLAQQEFILPKREKQAKLIDMFKQFDETRELVRQQKETLKKLKQKLLNEILG